MPTEWLNYRVADGAGSKAYTLTTAASSLTIGFTLCDNAYADYAVAQATGWKLLLMPVLPEAIPSGVYNVPTQVAITANKSGRTVTASVPRATLAFTGSPPTWKYVLGFILVVGGNGQTALVGLLSGNVKVDGQTEPSLICSVV